MFLGARAWAGTVGVFMMAAGGWLACDSRVGVARDVEPVEASAADANPIPAPPDASGPADASASDARALDGAADVAPPTIHRVVGHVDYGGDVAGATVTLLAPFSMTTQTDAKGDFELFLPEGRTAIVKVVPPSGSVALPMIRGFVVRPNARFRQYYLVGQDERMAAQALGVTVDPTKAIVEVDFRNAASGGYSATLRNGLDVLVPGFGIAVASNGTPTLSTSTVAGGGGSTLFLGNLTPATFSVTPSSPGDAGACQPCDATELPMEPGVVTWVDFECGAAACQ
jgi:hypothetical protein